MAKNISPSFGFSLGGTKEEVIKELEDISFEGRPPHAPKIVSLVRDMVNATAEHTTFSISINTHIEQPPTAPASKEE